MRKYSVALLLCAALAGCAHGASSPIAVSPGLVGPANTLDVTIERAVPADAAIDMVGMEMPTKVYALHPTGSHTYEANGVMFSMAGTWRVSVRDSSGTLLTAFLVTVR